MQTKLRTYGSNLRLGALAISTIALAIVLNACVPISSTPTAMANSDAAATYHLELFDTEVSGVTTPIDLLIQDDFPGLGDIILEDHDVIDVTTQETVGNTITRVHVIGTDPEGDAAFLIDCTVILADGAFHFTGGGKFSDYMEGDGVTVPIVGGTEAYTFAVGTVHMKFGELGEHTGAYLTADITIGR